MQVEDNNHKVTISLKIRRLSYLACIILVAILTLGGMKPGYDAFKQAIGVRFLLQGSAGTLKDDSDIPFICMREGEKSAKYQKALLYINENYLRGVALCLAGEYDAGLAALGEASDQSNAKVQYIVGIGNDDVQTIVDNLIKRGLTEDDLVAVIKMLSTQKGNESYQALRILARMANNRSETWDLWLQGSSRLEALNDWQAAIDWINEGLKLAPLGVRSSLYMRAGQIYENQSDSRDYKAALMFYNLAIQNSSWIHPEDEVYAHLYRGNLYRILSNEYGADKALEEFELALKLQPGSYWVFMNIANVYLFDLKDMDLAETYYRQALDIYNQDPYTYLYLGYVYEERGDNDTAAYWYKQALVIQPDFQPAIDRLKELEGK